MELVQYLIIIIVIIYFGMNVFAYFLSDRLLFPAPDATYTADKSIFKITLSDGSLLSTRYYESPGARYTILYCLGNSEDLGTQDWIFKEWQKHGYNLLCYEYPGYGTSTGIPTEYSAYMAINAAYDYLVKEKKTPPDKLIVYGRSIGGGSAIDLASRRRVAALITEATFKTAFTVWTNIKILPWDKFNNIEKIKMIRCPILIIHGDKDKLIPVRHAWGLWSQTEGRGKLYIVPGAGHNNILAIAEAHYWQYIQEFINNLK